MLITHYKEHLGTKSISPVKTQTRQAYEEITCQTISETCGECQRPECRPFRTKTTSRDQEIIDAEIRLPPCWADERQATSPRPTQKMTGLTWRYRLCWQLFGPMRLQANRRVTARTIEKQLNLLKTFDGHCCHMGTAIKHPVADQVKPSFVIFDIRALWRSVLSVRVPGCQKLQMTA